MQQRRERPTGLPIGYPTVGLETSGDAMQGGSTPVNRLGTCATLASDLRSEPLDSLVQAFFERNWDRLWE